MGEEEELASELNKRVLDSVATIKHVAAKSGNLKGSFQRALKEAASSISDAVEVLHKRSSTDETKKLQAANARLQGEVAELRNEIADLRREMMTARAPLPVKQIQPTGSAVHHDAQPAEELEHAILRQVGGMLNARLEALEERLLPQRRIRPPLAADRKNAVARMDAEVSEPEAGPSGTAMATAAATLPISDTSKKSRRKKSKKQNGTHGNRTSAASGAEAPRLPRLAPANENWATVAKRGRKKAGNTTAQASQLRHSQPQANAVIRRQSDKAEKVTPKLRAPRSSAVVITIQPEAAVKGITYAEALAEAKRRVDLTELGITSLQFRKAASGGRVLEVPGGASGDKADALAEKLRGIFSQGDIRVSRPVKCAELRITGLDDSVTKEEVAAAIARVGQCQPDSVKANDIRCNPAGIGTIFVRCPVTAAKKVTNGGRLLVGWVSAQVKLLMPRPLQCFRCLEVGHVREQCRADTDRSSQCYRCGQLGHKSSGCSAEPHCTLCAAANKPAGHRVGSKACARPPKKYDRKVTAEATAQLHPTLPSTRAEAGQMDVH